jgi:hypothetical protein
MNEPCPVYLQPTIVGPGDVPQGEMLGNLRSESISIALYLDAKHNPIVEERLVGSPAAIHAIQACLLYTMRPYQP